MIPGLGGSSGEGNGNPLQYSYLENPMERGAWWTTIHGARKELDQANYSKVMCYTGPPRGTPMQNAGWKGGPAGSAQGSLVYPEGPSLHHIPSQSWVQQLGYNTKSTVAKEKVDK